MFRAIYNTLTNIEITLHMKSGKSIRVVCHGFEVSYKTESLVLTGYSFRNIQGAKPYHIVPSEIEAITEKRVPFWVRP